VLSSTESQLDVQAALSAGEQALAGRSDSARLDAELLLSHALRRNRAWLYANPQAPCSASERTVFEALLAGRAVGRPLAQLTGEKEFWSLPLAVSEYTLIPRPETEGLVEQALQRLPPHSTARVLELGTGSGAIAVALATERPALRLVATDRCEQALEVARTNAARHAPTPIEFRLGDWYAVLQPGERFAMIVSNPPYIGETETPQTDAELRFEPTQALYSGRDGLNALRHIISGAADRLEDGGWLLLEHGFRQAVAVAAECTAAGLTALQQYRDLAGHPRVTCARYSGGGAA